MFKPFNVLKLRILSSLKKSVANDTRFKLVTLPLVNSGAYNPEKDHTLFSLILFQYGVFASYAHASLWN